MALYKSISDLGRSVYDSSQNPLNYCLLPGLDSSFNNGGTANTIGNPYGANCQAFMSDYCAKNWNDICEISSRNKVTTMPNSLQTYSGSYSQPAETLTAGEILIANTAARKYLTSVVGNCQLSYQPFDPTVVGSPLISYWDNAHSGQACVPIYEVDAKTIDSDPVMNKILQKPIIAWALLVNIYNTAVRKNTLEFLKGTKLYTFFQNPSFQAYVNSKKSINTSQSVAIL